MTARPEPYILGMKQPFLKAMAKDSGLPDDIRNAVLVFITTQLCHDPWKFGKQIKAPDKYAGKNICKRENYTVIFEVDDYKREIQMCAVTEL